MVDFFSFLIINHSMFKRITVDYSNKEGFNLNNSNNNKV